MKRFHVHAHVNDPSTSIAFYSKMFGTEPVRIEDGHAKWMLDDPRINFAISTHSGAVRIAHLGIQADDDAELAELKARVNASDLSLLDEGQTTCCYARSEKHCGTDPKGIAWEHFHTLRDIPVFSEAKLVATSNADAACCASTAGSGRPMEAPVSEVSSCVGTSA